MKNLLETFKKSIPILILLLIIILLSSCKSGDKKEKYQSADLAPTCFSDLAQCAASCHLPRTTSVLDCGYANMTRGWYDVSSNGAKNDYCRWIGVAPNLKFACKLAGSSDDYAKNADGSIKDYSTNVNDPHDPLLNTDLTMCAIKPRATNIVDCGYADKVRGWYDFSNNGAKNDYCRWIGVAPNLKFACKLAGSSDDYAKNADGSIIDFSGGINNSHDPISTGQTNCPVYGFTCQNGTCSQGSECSASSLNTTCWPVATDCQARCNSYQCNLRLGTCVSTGYQCTSPPAASPAASPVPSEVKENFNSSCYASELACIQDCAPTAIFTPAANNNIVAYNGTVVAQQSPTLTFTRLPNNIVNVSMNNILKLNATGDVWFYIDLTNGSWSVSGVSTTTPPSWVTNSLVDGTGTTSLSSNWSPFRNAPPGMSGICEFPIQVMENSKYWVSAGLGLFSTPKQATAMYGTCCPKYILYITGTGFGRNFNAGSGTTYTIPPFSVQYVTSG